MAGRPKKFDAVEAVEKASLLFWEKGYEASSTEDLLQAMGLQRGSFYHTFGSKKEVFKQAIDLHEKRGFGAFEKILADSDAPITLIKSVFLELADCSEQEHSLGCFLGNTIAELSNIDEELSAHARRHLVNLENMLFEQISLAQQNGTLTNPENARVLARYLLNLWNGINITRRMYPQKKDLLPLIELQLSVLH